MRFACHHCCIKFWVDRKSPDGQMVLFSPPSLTAIVGPHCPLCDEVGERIPEREPCYYRWHWPVGTVSDNLTRIV